MFFLGFSLNGELMMDRMGQEIAFKGIDLSSQFVPTCSLSAGQHARVNFGQVRLRSLIIACILLLLLLLTMDYLYLFLLKMFWANLRGS